MKIFKSSKPLAGFSSLERMVSRLIAYKGESVVVEWEDDDADWPTFRVLSVDIEKHRVWLKGEDDEDGNMHVGDEFWAAVAEIKRVRRRAANKKGQR